MKKILILLTFTAMFCFGQDVQGLEKECNDGNYTSCAKVARLYFYGDDKLDIEYDFEKALKYGKMACDNNEFEFNSCRVVGELYFTGWSLEKEDYKKALDYLTKSCKNNEYQSCGAVGYIYLEGLEIEQDYSKAFVYYKKGCGGKHPLSCYHLGSLYYDGQGVVQDILQAKGYYKKACDLSYQEGCKRYNELNK
ncbi:MAG: sel1 repeat family protein [Campylobacteraceae bacterium]|jgi:TPR repeat protein|nr:sel1 repeat family protein [Campylobacteraceae bacterium]